MILIAHRGNTSGPSKLENSPTHIEAAVSQGYDVEMDVWYQNKQFYLGHDKPTYLVSEEYLTSPRFWCHAKNIDTLARLVLNKHIHCFFHQNDDVTLTSFKYLWTFPGKKLVPGKSIAVMPEHGPDGWDVTFAQGICSDYISKFVDSLG